MSWECVSSFHLAQSLEGHFGDESFQTVTCTGTDNSKQTLILGKNKNKKHDSLWEIADCAPVVVVIVVVVAAAVTAVL